MGRNGERRTRLTRAAIAAALALVLTAGGGLAAQAVDYPTWDEIEAARGSEAATASTIGVLETLLDGLVAEAARLGDEAVARAAEADAAQAAFETAADAAASLADRAGAAADRARDSAERAAQAAAALYRTGGADLTSTMLLTGDDDLLSRLGTLDRVGTRVNEALTTARTDANDASALAAQSEVARAERERLSTSARAAAQTARAAQEQADAAVAAQQSQLTQLYAQLATLRNTTAQLEQEYRIGQQGNNDPGSGGSGDGPPIPSSDVNDVTAARAYAFAVLASWGFGSDQNECLLWLWNRESGWRTNAYNASSGAYGIPQSLPGSKMAAAGADWRTNYRTQVDWGLIYISNRYGTPCGAWAHSQARGWY